MILIDANILVYAHVSSFSQHDAARDSLYPQLNGPTRLGLPWVSLLAFLRLVTNPRVFEVPSQSAMRGAKYAHGSHVRGLARHGQRSGIPISSASFSDCRASMAT